MTPGAYCESHNSYEDLGSICSESKILSNSGHHKVAHAQYNTNNDLNMKGYYNIQIKWELESNLV